MGRGWADLPAGSTRAPQPPPHRPAGPLVEGPKQGPQRDYAPQHCPREGGAAGAREPWGAAAWGPGEMGTHHATTHRIPLLWRGDDDRPCPGMSAWHSQTRGAVCTSVCLTATHVLCRGMEKRLLAGCDSVWGLQGLQAAACDCVCDPCGCWRWVMACRGTACAGWSVRVYAVFRVCMRWVRVSCTRRLCLVKRCVCGWLQTVCTGGGWGGSCTCVCV